MPRENADKGNRAICIMTPAYHEPMSLYWWARPHAFTFAFMTPLFLICAALPDDMFVNWKHAQNFMDAEVVALGLLGLSAFGLSAWLVPAVGRRRYRSYGTGKRYYIEPGYYRATLYSVLGICLAAYVLLFAPAIMSPGRTLAMIGRGTEIRETLNQTPGITSLVNVGAIYVTLLLLQPRLTGLGLSRFDRIVCGVFLAIVAMRVFLWSERAALVEVVIPVAIVGLSDARRPRLVMVMFPIFAMIALLVFFGVTEYFRSWSAHYSETGISLTEFVTTRLFGYYATALNNGAVITTSFETPYVPYSLAQWFFAFPGVSDLSISAGWDVERRAATFFNYTNPEFNNPSGLFAPFYDVGPWAGTVVWVALGLMTGRLYAGFVSGQLLPLILYPSWMTGLYEVLRVFYWGSSRYFPVLVFVPIVYWVLARGAVRTPARRRVRLVRTPIQQGLSQRSGH